MEGPPGLDRWAPLSPSSVAGLFRDTAARWWLSGGIAFDLWLGRATRPHGDIDVSVLRADWEVLAQALPTALEAHAALDGAILPLPRGPAPEKFRNIWVADVRLARWVLQINLEDGDESHWRYRRCISVTRPWAEALDSRQGTAIVSRAVQLLWKARDPAAKDEADFEVIAPQLPEAELRWLFDAVAAAHPRSPWFGRLSDLAAARPPQDN